MDSHDSGVSVYAEAKGEYTKQLVLFIVPTFHRFFMNCLTQASEEELNQKRQLWKFQELLSQVPEWNIDKVQREIQKFIVDIQCDYLEELVTAVFIAHTKVLTAIRIGNKNKRVQITIPKLDHFLHRALSECSRLLWSSAYLFHNELSPIEKQKNHRQIEGLLHEGIGQAIRGLLPVKNILKDYLSEPEGDEKDDDKDDKDDENDKEDENEKENELPVINPTELTNSKSEVKPKEPDLEAKVPDVPKVETKVSDVPEVETKVSDVPKVETKVSDVPKVETKSETQQTLVIDTEPLVRFTNFDQVIQENGTTTNIDYVENKNDESDEIEFIDDSHEGLSDYEDLTQIQTEPLQQSDFETL
jgi:hypothetical protein